MGAAHQLPTQHGLFTARLPRRAYATDNLNTGIRLLPAAVAVQKRHIQASPPTSICWLLFDVDRPDAALRWEEAGLPAPTWVARNPANGHAHLAYGLAVPVAKSDAARAAPLRLAAAIEAAFVAALGADVHYTGLITKNPLHPSWDVTWHCRGEHDLYALQDLADYVTLGKKSAPETLGALGRNCALFDALRLWAYKAVRAYFKPGGMADWQAAVHAHARAHNTFTTPLPEPEVRAIARSVAKWVWQRFTPAEFRTKQGKRGRRKGESVRVALLPVVRQLRADGLPLRAIADEVGVSFRTVSNWLKRDDTRQPETPPERRLHALRLHREGATTEQVAMVLGVSVRHARRLLSGLGADICAKALSDITGPGGALGGFSV
jgi:transcriptional regulator with XRE-family HTH domain